MGHYEQPSPTDVVKLLSPLVMIALDIINCAVASSPALTANFDPIQNQHPEPIAAKFVTVDYMGATNTCAKLVEICPVRLLWNWVKYNEKLCYFTFLQRAAMLALQALY